MRRLLPALLLALPALAFAQGALTPPSAPAPTMRTLDQIEPRIPLGAVGGSTAPIKIQAPGSYVLLGNLSCENGYAIIIAASNVTLDLNGFTVSAADIEGANAISGSASATNITIRNGHIAPAASAGSLHFGIYLSGTNSLVEDMSVTGTRGCGILLDRSAGKTGSVRRCVVSSGTTGIEAPLVSDSHAVTTSHAIRATEANHCIGESAEGTGLTATTAVACTGTSTSGAGISASIASHCQGFSTSGTGLATTSASDALDTGTAENCLGTSSSGIGLQTGTAINCTGRSVSNNGLQANLATNCRGLTTSKAAIALWISGTATGCRGSNTGATGTGAQSALTAAIAVACTAETGTIYASSRQLGTP